MKLRARIITGAEKVAKELCLPKKDKAPLRYGPYYLSVEHYGNVLSEEYIDYYYFSLDEPLSPIHERLPEIPKDLIERVTLVDHIVDPRKFLKVGAYEFEPEKLRAYVLEQAVKERIVQILSVEAPSVAVAIAGLATLRRKEMKLKIPMEPHHNFFARLRASFSL